MIEKAAAALIFIGGMIMVLGLVMVASAQSKPPIKPFSVFKSGGNCVYIATSPTGQIDIEVVYMQSSFSGC